MKFHFAAFIILLTSVTACNKKDAGSSPRPQNPVVQSPGVTPEPAPITEEDLAQENKSEEFVLQVTALNFIKGGAEKCSAKHKLFKVHLQDNHVKNVVCKNSSVELSFYSDKGLITYEAVNLITGIALLPNNTGTEQSYSLGYSKGMQRFWPENPFGFTYLMIEDVSGADEKALKEMNELSERYNLLKAKELHLTQLGKRIPASLQKELDNIQKQLDELSQKNIH